MVSLSDSTEICRKNSQSGNRITRFPSQKYVLIIKYVQVTVARYKVAGSRSQLLGDCELIKLPVRCAHLASAISLVWRRCGSLTVQLRLRVIFQKINARAIPKARSQVTLTPRNAEFPGKSTKVTLVPFRRELMKIPTSPTEGLASFGESTKRNFDTERNASLETMLHAAKPAGVFLRDFRCIVCVPAAEMTFRGSTSDARKSRRRKSSTVKYHATT
ncbi:hypothetical protein K0M31_018599 [Melipona bicolor]|uniref:Uncharacterized protein n=1 Tax=Melipona bicolor TaxID=60889 RepID=A0AA40G3W8_9HYME|nr:hypothetical protein K0M31_018599 [Melipona bicolor]